MKMYFKRFCCIFGLVAAVVPALANVPGGGTGTGANVTLTDNGSTVTLANGIVSIVCSKSGATIHQINYTYNNGGGTQTINLLSGGNNGGLLYWESSNNQGLTFSNYTVVANTGNYAEISVSTTSESNSVLEVHFSMLRGSTGFYVTPIWYHRGSDGAWGLGECRDNIYAGSIFNWMSVDAQRNRLMEVSGGSAIGVQGAPKEVSLWTNGIYAGQYEDKYKYSADFGDQRVWGWSSVGTGGKNVGLWNVTASAEYYNGGPLKRELMCHIGTTILNMLNGNHYGGGSDGSFAAGEVWSKVCGPYFIYCNNVTNTITGTNAAAQALYNDALAQADAEATAWPYSWFTNASYAPASDRGVVKGQIVINDSGNPNASASNLWVGLVQQPITINNVYDFQDWAKPYQFWVKTDTNGSFTIPNIIATTNYTLYAFGPGAAGTFQSHAQSGGSAPNTLDIPASQFYVLVTAGATNNLGTVTWTPTRNGPTVFQIGYPDRTGRKFRHGEDYWVGDIGPSPSAPSPVWSKWLEYPFDFPNGVNYTVGQSRWTTDWNFCQPVVYDSAGAMHSSTSAINFDLASNYSGTAAFYIALSSDYQGPLIIKVNGTDITPPTTGYYPAYSGSGDQSDATIRESIHAMYSDNRITFNANLLQTGSNTITIQMRKNDYFANHAMYDYLRLEVPGYVPPPPPSVSAYAGNHGDLVCWPAQPGATSYNVLRSTTSGSGYVSITNGVIGPVCGSGLNNATFLDTTAANGTTYYYVVRSVNPVGASTNSPESSGATPNAGLSTSAPSAPTGVAIGSSGHQSVTVNWSASAGADFYTIYRSTLFNNGGGASNVLGTIVLANNVTGTTYTDDSPTDGSIYRYFVTATGAGGTSGDSAAAVAVPKPAPPASEPQSMVQTAGTTNSVSFGWSPVSGAVGYEISRATSSGGPFTFVQPVAATNYTDGGLDAGTTYYYQVAAMNAGGVSTNATLSAFTVGAPAPVIALPGNAQVEVTWGSSPGATNYVVESSTTNGGPYTLIGATTNTSYLDTGLVNGTAYYYVVYANTPFGSSPLSEQASGTPSTNVQVVTTATLPGTAITSATGPTLATSSTFDLNGGNAVVLLVTSECSSTAPTLNATFAGQPMVLGVATNLANQWAGIFYLINPTNHSGPFVITSPNSDTTGLAYSAMGLENVGSVAGSDGYASTTTTLSTIVPLNYTTATNGGFVFGACVNNGYNSTYPAPIFVSGNANQTLLPSTIISSSGHLHTFGPVSAAGSYTDNYSNPYERSAFVTLAFEAAQVLPPITWAVGNGDWDINLSSNWNNGVASATYQENNGVGNDVTFDDTASGASPITVTLNTNVSPASVTVSNVVKDYLLSGSGSINGGAALAKAGGGTLTLTTANTYSGGTTIDRGVLLVNNPSGSGTGSGSVTVNSGGTLGGTGFISGTVVVNSGGLLAPGSTPALASIGTLTCSNSLTLSAGSTNIFGIAASPLTNDLARIAGALTNGGTLIVTNVGTASLTNGDSFKLFDAGSFNGTFANMVLPPLSAGLGWDTSSLNTSGLLSVVATGQSGSNSPINVTATLPGIALTNAPSPTIATSSTFDLNGGNAVALLFTAETTAGNVIGASFAGQPMTVGVATNEASQLAMIFYLINPTNTSGQFVITNSGTDHPDCAYSAIALGNVGGVASANGVANTATSGTIALGYTTQTNGGFVLAACVNNGYNSSRPAPSYVSGNADQTLFGPAIVDANDGHLHAYGPVAVAGTYTDVYGNPFQRNAYVTLAFDAAASTINPNPPVLMVNSSGNQLTLSWPTNGGWMLQMQTNRLSSGLGTNWVDMPDSTNMTSTNIVVDPNQPAVFYRLKL